MDTLENKTQSIEFLNQFNLLANQVVEGFISGIHKSPFHGFSSEFAEHKIYNLGENVKNIDWKIFAKTEKLYIKKYDDETNMRCHVIIDNSSSMHYPEKKQHSNFPYNKIQYASLFTAAIFKIIKKQRDAAGLTVFSNQIDYTSKELGNEKHFRTLIQKLNETVYTFPKLKQTSIVDTLHQIAEKIHKRSMIILFSDLFEHYNKTEELFNALQHLKYNKHKVIIFQVLDKKTEIEFNFDNSAKKFIDLESGDYINLHTEQAKDIYSEKAKMYCEKIKNMCQEYKIEYHLIDISEKIENKLLLYLTEKQKFK